MIKYFIFLCISFECIGDINSDFEHAFNLNRSGNIDQASLAYKKLIDQNPWCTSAIYNYAHTLKDLGFMQAAIEQYNKVIEKEPTHFFAHFGLSQCYLSTGMYKQGFELFEYRSKDIQSFKNDIETLKTLIAQTKSLSNIKILLRCEWGIGDNIQFIRFAQELKNRGAIIYVQTHNALKKIFSLCPYLDKVIEVGELFPPHDLQIPILSLGYILDINLASLESRQPYIYADPLLVETWRKKISANATFNIGICWQGNGDRQAPALLNKNISLQELMPICEIKKTSVYSLQKFQTNSDFKTAQIHFFNDFDETNGRFMDTAALIQVLDLIITVDTSIAHLAGALGKPVWLLLPFRSDWRWMQNRNDSPWYSTMCVFRQPCAGDWKGLMNQVCTELQRRKV